MKYNLSYIYYKKFIKILFQNHVNFKIQPKKMKNSYIDILYNHCYTLEYIVKLKFLVLGLFKMSFN